MLIKMGNEKEQPGDHLDGRNTHRVRYGFHRTFTGKKIFGCERCIFSSGVHSCSLGDTPTPNQGGNEKGISEKFFETKLDS